MAVASADLLGGLTGVYLKQLKTRLASLRQVILDIKLGRADASTYKSLRAEAHRLNGTGATYGFPKISTTAEKLETHLASEESDPDQIIRLLNPLVEAIIYTLTNKDIEIPPPSEPPKPAPNFRILSATHKPTILVADDDPDILDLVRQLLSPWANVQCSETGYAALMAMESRRFDLVILDYEFADISGLDVLIQASRMGAEVRSPIIMMSANRERQKVLQIIAAGAQNYLVKPISPNVLLERVALLLSRQRKIILVADDDPLIREIFRKRFIQRGHEVVLAVNGAQALEVTRKIHPQAILLDRQMPRMTGDQFLKELRQRDDTRQIPVIMLSAQCMSDDIRSGYRDGANAYINKPFVPDHVIKCCENLLNTTKWDIVSTKFPDGGLNA